MKCKKDKVHAKNHLCPVCVSPLHLSGKHISEPKDLQCTGPVIGNSPGKDVLHEEYVSELLSLEDFKPPFGNITLNLSDEHGNTVNLTCQVVKPRESTEITWNYTESLKIFANMNLSFDLECPMDRNKYASLWRLLAYYIEVALHLRREIMLSKGPELSYRYRQDIERDAYYYTGVQANILSHPSWLMQLYVNIQLNRLYSTSKTVKLIFTTQMSSATDSEQARWQKRSWVMIKHNNLTQMTFSSVVGSMIEMDCSVMSSGGLSIKWMLPDGSKVQASFSSANNRLSVSSTGKLLIKAVDHSDSGVYYCIAEVLGDVDLLPFRLSVVESSRLIVGDEVKVAFKKFIGESAYLPCNTIASPDADVNWIFPDGSMMNAKANSSRVFIFSNGTLFIPHCRPDDNGYYKCVALNQHGEDTLSAKLTVMRRGRTQPLRWYPPSAAGVSTKVRAILEDMEESSGDDTGQKRMPSNRGFMNQRREPQSRSQAYSVRNLQGNFPGHRNPIKKGLNGQQRKDALWNRRKINKSNNKIEPQRWADLWAKIRQKTLPNTTTPSPYSGIPLERVQTVDPKFHTNIEGSSLDDASPLKKEPYTIIMFQTHNGQPVTAPLYIQYQLHQIMPPESSIKSDEVTLKPVKTTAAPNYVTTEINILDRNYVNPLTTSTSHREERQRSQWENNPAVPNSELKNALGISVKSADVKESCKKHEKDSAQWMSNTSTQTTKVISANVIKQRAPSSSYSRTPWNSRKHFGSRGRINRLRIRPSLSLITSKPQLTAPTATRKQNPSIIITTSATLTAGTSADSTATAITFFQNLKSLTNNDRNGNDQTNVSLLADKINLLDFEFSTTQRTKPILNVLQYGLHPSMHITPLAVTGTTSQRRANKDTSEESWKDVQTFTTEVKMTYHVASTTQPEADYKTIAASQGGFTTQFSALKPSKTKSVPEDETTDTSPHISESHTMESFSSLQILNSTHKSVKSATDPVKLLQSPAIFPYEETKAEDLLKKPFSDSSVKQSQTGFLTTVLHTVPDEYNSVFPITTPGPEVGDRELLLTNISKPSGIISTTISTMPPPTTKAKIQLSAKPHITTTSTTMTPSIKSTESGFNTPIITSNFAETTPLKPSIPKADNRIPFYSRNPPTNHTPDQNPGRALNYKYPNHRNSFIIHQTPSYTDSSVDVRGGSVGTIRSSMSPKAFITTTQTTPTSPTPTAKLLSRIQTSVASTDQHLGKNVPLLQPPYVPVLSTRSRITTANLTTIAVNAETDVQFPCNYVGEPKPFLTWTKISTGINKQTSNIQWI